MNATWRILLALVLGIAARRGTPDRPYCRSGGGCRRAGRHCLAQCLEDDDHPARLCVAGRRGRVGGRGCAWRSAGGAGDRLVHRYADHRRRRGGDHDRGDPCAVAVRRAGDGGAAGRCRRRIGSQGAGYGRNDDRHRTEPTCSQHFPSGEMLPIVLFALGVRLCRRADWMRPTCARRLWRWCTVSRRP